MKITKSHLNFYRMNKVKNPWNIEEDKINIHKLINIQINYDPFNMREKGTKRHNSINRLRLIYSNYKKGYITKTDFILKLEVDQYLTKYIKRFK